MRVLLEWIRNFFGAIYRGDEDESRSTDHNQAKIACFIRVEQIFLDMIQDEVHKAVKALQDADNFATACELDTDLLVLVFR